MSRWLDEEGGEPSQRQNEAFQRWLDSVEYGAETRCFGKILVDAAVFSARFLCRPAACAPWAKRGAWRCCCADAELELTEGERRRIKLHLALIWRHLNKNRRRFGRLLRGQARLEAFFEKDGPALRRPGGRCIFSTRGSDGSIRCELYEVAAGADVDPTEIVPHGCRLFPLVLARLSRGRVALSVVSDDNYQALQAPRPARYPCLSSPGRPPLVRSMAATLDWLFGAGFARLLRS